MGETPAALAGGKSALDSDMHPMTVVSASVPGTALCAMIVATSLLGLTQWGWTWLERRYFPAPSID